jgi:acetyl esterase/lipase
MKLTLALVLLAAIAPAADTSVKKPAAPAAPAKKVYPKNPTPTQANVRYGPHERNVFDFWQAKSDKPTPLLFFIHGGGWTGGDKAGIAVEPFLKEGISVVSINYRYTTQAQDVSPPVKAPLHDAARALQFVRSKAGEWNIDSQRIGASGGSAGACSSLWLAFHPDMADPKSNDPIARQSTRLWCAAVMGAQTTLDPKQMKEWTPNSRYGGHAFGFRGDPAKKLSPFDEFLAKRDTILPWIAEYSPYALVTPDDPPVYLYFSAPPAIGQEQKDPTHTANFGVKLQEHCKANGVAADLVYPGAPDVKFKTTVEYLVAKLKAPK